MILKFATKRDQNGNRYFLGIDTENKTYSKESAHWYSREDITEVSKKDRHKLLDILESENYTEVNHI